jgi:hypothetical protein
VGGTVDTSWLNATGRALIAPGRGTLRCGEACQCPPPICSCRRQLPPGPKSSGPQLRPLSSRLPNPCSARCRQLCRAVHRIRRTTRSRNAGGHLDTSFVTRSFWATGCQRERTALWWLSFRASSIPGPGNFSPPRLCHSEVRLRQCPRSSWSGRGSSSLCAVTLRHSSRSRCVASVSRWWGPITRM